MSPSSDAQFEFGAVAPRFSRPITWAIGLLLAGLMAGIWLPAWTADRTANLRYPAESAARLMERHIEFYVGLERLPSWQAGFYVWLYGDRASALDSAAEAYRDVLAHFESHPGSATEWATANTRARLALVLLEAGDRESAAEALVTFGAMPEDSIVEDTIRYAYNLNPKPVSAGELQAGLRLMPVGWSTDTLGRRLAERQEDRWLADRIEARQLRRAEVSRQSTGLLVLVTGGLMLAGVGALGMHLVRRRPLAQAPPRPSPAIWEFEEGIGVLVRAGFFGVLIYLLLGTLGSWFKPHLAAQWSTLLASMPMLWMIRRHLLAPRALGFIQAFGLNPLRAGFIKVLGATLILVLVERTGALLISWSLWNVGVQPHWTEGLAERWIWGPWQATLISSVNTIAWAPVLEEIGFRGLLFLTLRSRFGFAISAVLSAAVFSLLHPYSLAAMLAVLWSGFLWAYAFERFRTLLPGMLAHSATNFLAVTSILLIYR